MKHIPNNIINSTEPTPEAVKMALALALNIFIKQAPAGTNGTKFQLSTETGEKIAVAVEWTKL